MLKKVLSYINVRPDKNQSWLLVSLVISGLLITYAHPTLVKEIISNLPAQWIAFESLSTSIVGLLIGVIWQSGVSASQGAGADARVSAKAASRAGFV